LRFDAPEGQTSDTVNSNEFTLWNLLCLISLPILN